LRDRPTVSSASVAVQERIPSRLAAALSPLVERVFYNDVRADEHGRPLGVSATKRPAIALNRSLFERGITPPWVWTPDQCARFWETRDATDRANGAIEYARKPLDVVSFMNDFWQPHVSSNDSVLEVGCNSGPNLEGLRRLGFSTLAGVEISSEAVAEMQRAFPELAMTATIHHGRAEEALPTLGSGSCDVVFAMAVLHHVHPASRAVMAQMVRIASRHVCVIEPEDLTCSYVFARNYKRVFERLGCTQIKEETIVRESFPSAFPAYVGYRARLFRVPSRAVGSMSG
jgi:SAM-dependent methyltransferase